MAVGCRLLRTPFCFLDYLGFKGQSLATSFLFGAQGHLSEQLIVHLGMSLVLWGTERLNCTFSPLSLLTLVLSLCLDLAVPPPS